MLTVRRASETRALAGWQAARASAKTLEYCLSSDCMAGVCVSGHTLRSYTHLHWASGCVPFKAGRPTQRLQPARSLYTLAVRTLLACIRSRSALVARRWSEATSARVGELGTRARLKQVCTLAR